MSDESRREYRLPDPLRPGPGGPWDDEADKVQWVDAETQLDCLIKRNPLGVWCGYVGVAEGNKYFGVDYNDADVSVHGGLTYSDFCQDTADEALGICHVPFPGRPHRVWWLGFDCGHGSDHIPDQERFIAGMPSDLMERLREAGMYPDVENYRDQRYVTDEVTSLATQLAGLR